MAFVEKSWNVEYDGEGLTKDAWNLGFKRLNFVQNVRSQPSHATHIFQCKFQLKGDPMQEQLMKEAAELAYNRDIRFNLSSREETPQRGTVHYHVIYDWVLRTDQNGFLLVLKTMDRTALAMIQSKTRAHRGTISSMVSAILEEYGMEVVAQTTANVSEFSTLLQRNMTDMQFILNELIPRAGGGYSVFTQDGKKVFFQTLNHVLPVFQPEMEAVVSVREYETNYASARLGGMIYTVHGFNPFTKKSHIYHATPTVEGPKIPMASLYDYVPLQTQEATTAWAKERQLTNNYEAFPMQAVFKGNLGLNLPLEIDFSKTKFRKTCTHSVPVVQIRHIVTAGRLAQTVTMLRNKGLV